MMKVTLPKMAEGQIAWDVYRSVPITELVSDDRRWHRRAIYKALMWLHDATERLWHWSYYASRKFAPPKGKTDWAHIHLGRYNSASIRVESAPEGHDG